MEESAAAQSSKSVPKLIDYTEIDQLLCSDSSADNTSAFNKLHERFNEVE